MGNPVAIIGGIFGSLALVGVTIGILFGLGVLGSSSQTTVSPSVTSSVVPVNPTEIPPQSEQKGMLNIKVENNSPSGVVVWNPIFKNAPTVVSSNILLATTPQATLTSFDVTNTQGTATISLAQYPLNAPRLLQSLSSPSNTSAVFLDSQGELWFSCSNPTDASQIYTTKGTGGLDGTSFPALSLAYTAPSLLLHSFFHEHNGNIIHISMRGSGGGPVGYYGSVTGSTFPNACTGFGSFTSWGDTLASAPDDSSIVFIPYAGNSQGARMSSSTDGGLSWTDEQLLSGTFQVYPSCALLNSNTGFAVYPNNSNQFSIFSWDGSSWTALTTITATSSINSGCSAAYINGIPCFMSALTGTPPRDVIFYRAMDASGSSWHPHVILGTTSNSGSRYRLGVSNGIPIGIFSDIPDASVYMNDSPDASGNWTETSIDNNFVYGSVGAAFTASGVILSLVRNTNDFDWRYLPTRLQVEYTVSGI